MTTEIPANQPYRCIGTGRCGAFHERTSVDACLQDGVVQELLADQAGYVDAKRRTLYFLQRKHPTAA